MRRLVSTAVIGALAIGAGTASSNQGAVVTAMVGDASAVSGGVAEQDALGDGETLELAEGGGCSILLDENGVVELCGGTRVSFETDSNRGVRIVKIDSGRLRMLVGPRTPGERIEIHTPAAIATILGTVVYVVVDPVTGASTFASSESQVEIQDREVASQGGVTIGALERLTVAPGEAHEKEALSPQQLDALGGCLLDFRDLALRAARSSREALAVERMLGVDGAAFELGFEPRDTDSGDLASEGVIDVTDTEEFRRNLPGDQTNPTPPDCEIHDPPIPGEHCDIGNPI